MADRIPLAVAHRGDPYEHRENTLPSLESALRSGADVVEVDVRITEDAVPVLLHDSTLRRLWRVDRPVAGAPSGEVRALGVPTLGEALELPLPRLMVDLMDPWSARAAVAEVHRRGAAERVYYCGGPAVMMEVRRRDPDAEIALTWKLSTPPPRWVVDGVRPRWINLPFGVVDRALVERVHGEGRLVGVWTADTPRTMSRLVRLGVDAVTTNRIGALLRLLGRGAAAPSPRGGRGRWAGPSGGGRGGGARSRVGP